MEPQEHRLSLPEETTFRTHASGVLELIEKWLRNNTQRKTTTKTTTYTDTTTHCRIPTAADYAPPIYLGTESNVMNRPGVSDDKCESEVDRSVETDDDEDLEEDQEIQDLSLVLEDTILYSELDHDEEFVPLPKRSEMKCFSVCWDNVQKIDEDWKKLRSRMKLIVARTLASILDIPVQQHLSHKYSKESAKKSEVINLGVVKENPATCKGVIEIMKYLNRYTPRDVEGKPLPIICHGDQRSNSNVLLCSPYGPSRGANPKTTELS
ncbi:hypothetical protein DPMN_009931 [Dreissena polymorpha]|uniref:Uncharacterized protein n=1 Tax=Dreissena polymorpha TaxID=45954 RepID=A0A9D4N264_DREPO|nr:hypothetical protein DPMN_009931 [Dreissena polymorpha]